MKKGFLSEALMLLCVLILGVCLTIWADKVTSLVSILLGCLALVYGISAMVSYFKNEDKIIYDRMQFIFGIIVLFVGLVLIFKVNFLKELVSFVIGMYIFVSSLLRLQECMIITKNSNIKMMPAIILSIVGILIGLLCIIGKFLVPDMIVTYIGIMLIIYSIVDFIELIIIRRK